MIEDSLSLKGEVIIEELKPGTDVVLTREVGENVICKNGADALAYALTAASATPLTFNYMVISTNTDAAARATTTILDKVAASTEITPTVAITGTTSITTWLHTFAATAGATATWKFGMQANTTTGVVWNEYKFSAAKDNWNNDLRITYNASFAP
jgi:hypothetical protein